jgi:outer membrane protein TolC
MRSVIRPAIGAVLFVLVSGCTSSSSTVAPTAVGEIVGQDIAKLYQPDDSPDTLTFEEALARGLRYNLDTKVAAYQSLAASGDITLARLAALPSLTAKWDFIGRSNKGAASSLSVLTNTQSLEPSISTEQYRMTQQLEMNWNLLDAALSVARARSSSDQKTIAEERRRKVFQNVVQDVYSAYWRSAAAQQIRPLVADLLKQANEQIVKIDQSIKAGIVVVTDARRIKSDILAKKQQLLELQSQLAFADLSLKVLIGLPPRAIIRLDPGDVQWLSAQRIPSAEQDVVRLETIALMNRPEVHEEILNKRIAVRDIKLSIFETFPGAEIILALNHDENKFLQDPSWLSITGEISQSITKILTAPARYNKAKSVSQLADVRRQALLAAVMTEVNVAHARFSYFKGDYDTVAEIAMDKLEELDRARNFRSAGMMGDTDVVNAALAEGIARINQNLAYAQAQESYGQMLNTLGIDIWGGDTDGMSVPQLADSLKQHIAELEQDIVTKPSKS